MKKQKIKPVKKSSKEPKVKVEGSFNEILKVLLTPVKKSK